MKRLMLTGLLAGSFLAFGCGGDDEESSSSLQCDWFADESNCYRQFVAAIDCLPTDMDRGTFSADRNSCQYDDGTTVAFDSPFAEDIHEVDELAFSLERDGETCLQYREESGLIEITSAEGTFRAEMTGTQMIYTCADGTKFSGSGLALMECENFFVNAPGKFLGGAGGYASLAISTGAGEYKSVFSCEPEAGDEGSGETL